MDPKISVIVPVYKAEQYLPRCIDSILAQSFTDFELLLIEDGTPDNSGSICDEYAAKDERIRVFHNPNQGVSATREFGVQHAQGDFIQFVDSDDWIESSMFELMYDQAIQEQADIVGCNFTEVYKDHNHEVRCYYETKDSFVCDIIASYWGVVWKHLVKRCLYIDNDIHFPKGINGGEDYIVCVKLFTNAKQVTCVDKSLYNYNRANESSIMSSFSQKKVKDQIDATIVVEEYLKGACLIEKYKKELDIRKFSAKLPLLKESPKEWLKYFPESDYVTKIRKIGTITKIRIFIVKFFCL